MEEAVIFEPASLLPPDWRHFIREGPVRMFNPGILEDGDGWILAFRAVGSDLRRRIGLCRLDREFKPVPGSQVAMSDLVRFDLAKGYDERSTNWFADPRLYRLADRLFVTWNSGWHEPMNRQFIQELDGSLCPLGKAREMVLDGKRRSLEKNWTFFGDGPFHCVYSIQPHRILEFSPLGEGDVVFKDAHVTEWSQSGSLAESGPLRGGAPPRRVGDSYWALCHYHHPGPEGLCYSAAAYRFVAKPPFSPLAVPEAPVRLPNPHGPRNVHERLNPAVSEVIYPCGAVFMENRWIASYGINDEHCALCAVPHDELGASTRPL